jgi:hypothetical protein
MKKAEAKRERESSRYRKRPNNDCPMNSADFIGRQVAMVPKKYIHTVHCKSLLLPYRCKKRGHGKRGRGRHMNGMK